MSPQKKRLVLIGAGLIGRRHLKVMNDLATIELCAIIDPSSEAERIAKNQGARYFKSLEDFQESDQACDGAVIATPNETHRPLTVSCLSHGIPCLVEKPLASTSMDAQEIAEASERLNTPILVGHHRRHHRISQKMKADIESGTLGQLVAAQSTWMLRKPKTYFESGQWRTQKGGGPIWINLIHEIDLLRYFMGEITEVSAMLSDAVRGGDVEDTATINLRCESGVLISAIISDSTPSPWHFEGATGENPNIAKTGEGGLRIFGTRGAIEFPSLTHWHHADDEGHWGVAIMANTPRVLDSLGREAALSNQLAHFIKVIEKSHPPLVNARDGVQSVRVIEAIHESATRRQTVKLEPAGD